MPAERIRDHAGQGATTVAARRRRLRADQARQLADLLRHQILAGAFPDGALPHEGTIGRDYGATRNTVRQALDLLRTEQLVERVPGLGTVVVCHKYRHGLDRLEGLAETLREQGRVTNEVRTVGPVPAPAPVAARLRVPEHSDVLYIERLRLLGGLPLSLDLTYVPMDIGADLIGCALEHTDVFRLLEALTGQPLGSAEITLEAVNADAHSAAVLQAPRGGPGGSRDGVRGLPARSRARRRGRALTDPAWQVRAGAATALRAAAQDVAVPALAKTLGDPNADVRKAAVLALLRHDGAEARAALGTATDDPDADVRAYAARSVTSARPA